MDERPAIAYRFLTKKQSNAYRGIIERAAEDLGLGAFGFVDRPQQMLLEPEEVGELYKHARITAPMSKLAIHLDQTVKKQNAIMKYALTMPDKTQLKILGEGTDASQVRTLYLTSPKYERSINLERAKFTTAASEFYNVPRHRYAWPELHVGIVLARAAIDVPSPIEYDTMLAGLVALLEGRLEGRPGRKLPKLALGPVHIEPIGPTS